MKIILTTLLAASASMPVLAQNHTCIGNDEILGQWTGTAGFARSGLLGGLKVPFEGGSCELRMQEDGTLYFKMCTPPPEVTSTFPFESIEPVYDAEKDALIYQSHENGLVKELVVYTESAVQEINQDTAELIQKVSLTVKEDGWFFPKTITNLECELY